MKASIAILSFLLIILYPLTILLGLNHMQPRSLAMYLFLVLVLRLYADQSGKKQLTQKVAWIIAAAGFALVIFTFVYNSQQGLKLYPVIVNCSFLIIFSYSLASPPTIIERIARTRDPELPPRAIVYTRKVTILWCVFFLLNGLVAFYTAMYSSVETWTVYNGFIAYVLMIALLSGEWLYRSLIIKRNS